MKTYADTQVFWGKFKIHEGVAEGVGGRGKDELDELRDQGVCAVTHPALLLDETFQLLLLGAQLLFQLSTAGLEPLCVLPSQKRRQWVLHPAHPTYSLGSMHLNSFISWASLIAFHFEVHPLKPQASVTHLPHH